MAETNYPLPVYNYCVDIDNETVAFSEVSGLSIAFETTTYKESPDGDNPSGPVVHYMPGQRAETVLTLKKGVVKTKSVAALYEWINSVRGPSVKKKDISIRLCDDDGRAVITWRVLKAFPTKLDAPTFDAMSNDAAIETMELKADSVTVSEH